MRTLELESLSGGEKVSVALALRLGMASLLGASNLNLMILDEPTTHLDAERKKSLVGVLSQLSNISNSETPMQFFIITHDSEIFEDSTVEQIYKFESTENGSKVISLVDINNSNHPRMNHAEIIKSSCLSNVIQNSLQP